jgi:GTP-binding protein
MAKQTEQAIMEADVICYLVDGRDGLTQQDKIIAEKLRVCGRPIVLLVNKTEGMTRHGVVTAEFHELGLGEPIAVSSAHGDGIGDMINLALDHVWTPEHEAFFNPPKPEVDEWVLLAEKEKLKQIRQLKHKGLPIPKALQDPMELPDPKANWAKMPDNIKLAIVGRPNVGKSTLINTLLGEERVIAFDLPGTTRDTIHIPFERQGKHYTLIDTAGIRKKGKVFEAIEKFSVIKTLQAISDAHVVLLMLDAQQDISEQDAHIAQYILESGRALVVAVNKWDGLDDYARTTAKKMLERKVGFLSFAKFHFISALNNEGIGAALRSIQEACAAAHAKLSTPKLTRAIIEATEKQQPPRKGIFRPKLRYAHQGGHNPPVIVVHGSALDDIPQPYTRYLESFLRDKFGLAGTPLRIEYKNSTNPYAERRVMSKGR